MNPTKQWWEEPNRLLLINLREGDEVKLNAKELVADIKTYGATAFSINAGGIVAFYDTKVPNHPKSKALNGRDLLAELIPLARESGLKILGRIDPSCAEASMTAMHPEWFARDKSGNLYPASDHYITCPNGGYYHGFMLEVVRELLENYDIDGLWNNGGRFCGWDTGMCYCPACRELFKKDTGYALPEKENWDDPAWRAYNEWRYRRIAAWIKAVYDLKNSIKPQAVWTAAVQFMEPWEFTRNGGWDVDYWYGCQDVVTVECQRRYTVPWWPGVQAKYLRANAANIPKWMTTSYFYPWWRLYAAPEEENRVWMAQQFAFGTATWLHINGGYSDYFDRRSYTPVREVMQRQTRWQEYFEADSLAKTALVFSRFSMDNYAGAQPEKRYMDNFRGYYLALLEGHIPFDVLSDKFLSPEKLSRYKVIILPNMACVSDETAAALERYARGGGTVIATFETGFCYEDGTPRPTPAFAELLGGTYAGATLHNQKSSYAQLRLPQDPLLHGIGDTDVIPNDGSVVLFAPGKDTAAPLTLIPPVQAHAGSTISIPEYSMVKEVTDHPVVCHSSCGAGRGVYMTNQMDLLFYRYGFRDYSKILTNAVRLGLGDADGLRVDAPEHVEISYVEQPGRRLLHLINYPVGIHLNTGWRRPGQTIIPAENISVRVRLPRPLLRVRLLDAGVTIAHTESGGWAEATIPRLNDHEIVVFDME